ncbi:TspO/MBR family protein [Agrobacterium sp.]|uniref:TspO/MBR family protein n=1 Tax=Agrobacterium sp. TaxID=361 RepID=UPI0028A7AEEF|nr:TspO/MBR family protein [Agrobacterium sp.]
MSKKAISQPVALALFIVIVLGVGIALGIFFSPGEWYAALKKPPFNPPNWVFGPAWTVLYVLIAVAGWRIWRRAGLSAAPMKIWYCQMILNWLWTPIFFGAQSMGVALVVITCLLFAIILFIARCGDVVAGLCFIPYALWVSFALLLNGSLLFLNG